MSADLEVTQSWLTTAMGWAIAILSGLFGFIWRQLGVVRDEARAEAQRVRTELASATKRMDDQLETAIQRIRIDLGLQENRTREDRMDTKKELREDNQNTKEEMKAGLAAMEQRLMQAIHARRST